MISLNVTWRYGTNQIQMIAVHEKLCAVIIVRIMDVAVASHSVIEIKIKQKMEIITLILNKWPKEEIL